jgi:hypothetical protein
MRLRSERLPWLEEPPPAAVVTAAPRAPAGSMWPWYLLLTLLVAAVAVGAWWLSTGKEAPAPVLPAEESIPIPVTRQEPAVADQPLALDEDASGAIPETGLPLPVAPRITEPQAPDPPEQRAERLPSRARVEARATRGVFPADEAPAEALPVAGPTPIILHHPDPNRGRVVQLGAFATRTQAEESWRRITRRYPYLATKPKMVNTVDVRGLGGGRPTRMYRLQLGTSSQAQSVVICQQLDRAGHSCVVVY